MNRNNLSWVDNKVLNNPGSVQNRPYQAPTMPQNMEPMPAQYQATPASPVQMGVSPATYQAPMAGMPNQMGVSPATLPEPVAKGPEQSGLSPGTYQTDPSMDLGMMGVPRPSTQPPGMQGTLTRTEAQDTSPFMEGPPSIMSAGYTPAYLRGIIGKRVRAEFVFQNLYLDKTGILREVGISYFVLEDSATHAMVMCDLYSVRFVTSV